MRPFFLTLLLGLSWTAVALAFGGYALRDPKPGDPYNPIVVLEDGEVRPFYGGTPRKAVNSWVLAPLNKDTESEIEAETTGKWRTFRLGYSLKGETPEVRLTKGEEEGVGKDWKFHKTKAGLSETYTIQAAKGKFAGWYLDIEKDGKEFKSHDDKPCKGHRVILVKEPTQIKEFDVDELSR